MADVGLSALEIIYKQLLIDDPWTIRGEGEFSWIGHRLQQTIRAGAPFEDEGITLSRLSASCVVVEGVTAPQGEVLRMLARVNRHAVGSAYTYWPSTQSISANAIAYVHDDTLEWRPKQYASLAILQLCLAETEADWLAERAGGTVAAREHPTSGRRVDADDMLNVLDGPFASRGRQPSLFANEFEMETIADVAKRSSRVASLGGSAEGVALEVAFGGGTSLTMLHTEEPHRRLGNGLTVRVNLPSTVTPEDADWMAASLNSQEAVGSAVATHYGAWCWDTWPTTGLTLAYQSFMPNALYQPGIAQDAAYSCVKRALWVDRLLNEKPAEEGAWQILARRVGIEPATDDAD
jgi:hypothetical protein